MARDEKPIRWKTLLVLLAVALGLGSWYRLPDLAKKPMHLDESVLAIKTQEYWKTGTFEYDLRDYHGPFLHHLTKWVGSLRGWSADTVTEQELRWVIAVCGLLLVLTPLLFMEVIGRTGAGVAALFLAVSPMMTYYSRYYIMEVPFVLQTTLFMACLWQWAKRKNKLWLLPAGLMLGWMHATKETFVLNVAAIVAACAVVKMMGLRFEINQRGYGFRSFTRRPKPWWSWVIFGAVAALASTWMYSNGFRDWQFVTDSVRTYESYLGRSQGAGGHEKPWHYYITLLFWRREGFLWTEALIGGLAIIGMLNAFLDRRRADHKRAFLIALSTYTLVLLLIYCIIPYKTPWSVLAVAHAFALLGGLGARTVFRAFTDFPAVKVALALLLAGGIYHLCSRTTLAIDWNYPGQTRYAASEAHNPYAYAHAVPKLVQLSDRLHELASKHPAGKDMPVQIIQREQGWPLKWYLRDLTHVGYQADFPEKIEAAAVVVDWDREAEAKAKLGEGWESSLWSLRAGVPLTLLVQTPEARNRAPAASPPLAPPPPPDPVSTPVPLPPAVISSNSPEAPVPAVPTPMPPAPSPAPTPAPVEPAVPRVQVVEDEAPFVGPPYPVPTRMVIPGPGTPPVPPPPPPQTKRRP